MLGLIGLIHIKFILSQSDTKINSGFLIQYGRGMSDTKVYYPIVFTSKCVAVGAALGSGWAHDALSEAPKLDYMIFKNRYQDNSYSVAFNYIVIGF